MSQSTNLTSHLNIPPSRIPRSSSHESFATDVSLLSLSSFASELPPIAATDNNEARERSQHRNISDAASNRDDLDLDLDNNDREMAVFREDMFEKMLECHSLSLPRIKNRHNKSPGSAKSSTSVSKFAEASSDATYFTPFLTISQEDLLKKCADVDPKVRGSLYKSFSTSDVPSKACLSVVDGGLARATSQIHVPTDYVQMLRCRKKHLKNYVDINIANGDDLHYCKDFLTTPTESADSSSNPEVGANANSNAPAIDRGKTSIANADRTSTSVASYGVAPIIDRRAPSAGGVGMFLKKLKFSKEVGRRIRDDLLRKLSKRKQSQRQVTKLDLDSDKGRPLSKYERNFMIFHWLQSLNEDSFEEP